MPWWQALLLVLVVFTLSVTASNRPLAKIMTLRVRVGKWRWRIDSLTKISISTCTTSTLGIRDAKAEAQLARERLELLDSRGVVVEKVASAILPASSSQQQSKSN